PEHRERLRAGQRRMAAFEAMSPRLLSRFEQDRSYFERVAKVHCVTTNFLISVFAMEPGILSPLWTPTPARTSHLSAGSIREILRTRMHRPFRRAEEPSIHR